jgi:hypothetical protein
VTLTVAAIERWDAESVREVFHAASRRAQATADAANGLATLPAITSWGGVAARAARDAIGQTRRDLDAHGREATVVANAACDAADEIERIQSDLAVLTADTESMGMEIDSAEGKVLPGRSVHDPMEALLKEQQLQPRLDKIVAEANLVDMALANAIHMADGSAPTPAVPHQQPPTEPPPHDPKPSRAEASAAAGDATDASAAAPGTTTSGQPTNLGEALAEVAGQPAGALDRSLDQHAGSSEGMETRSTRSPLTAPTVGADHSLVDQQRARVDSARQSLNAAQAKLDAAAAQTYTRGGSAGPVRGDSDALSQAVFDARRELTTQTKILEDLNNAAVALGNPTVAVPTLPENADVQAFPAKPAAFAEGSRALSDGSFGLIPDVAKDIDVFGHWGKYSGAEQTGAILDAAGMVPVPGAKALTEGIGHGLDALNAGRHLDDVPTPHIHVDDVPTGGHSPTTQTPHHHADTTDAHHIDHDTGHVAPYGFEDTNALLATSEASGGHLMERHVGQTVDDLAERLAANPKLGVVSTFVSVDEAGSAVNTALRHNQAALDHWIANGASKTRILTAPFDGGELLVRGAVESIPGRTVKLVLKGDGMGGWHILTGYLLP